MKNGLYSILGTPDTKPPLYHLCYLAKKLYNFNVIKQRQVCELKLYDLKLFSPVSQKIEFIFIVSISAYNDDSRSLSEWRHDKFTEELERHEEPTSTTNE